MPESSASRRARAPERRLDDAARHRAPATTERRHRIEVDAQLVRMVEILRADRMRMQLEAREVRHPREVGRVPRNDLVGGAARRKADRDDLDPRRARLRRALLEEELPVDAVRKAHEHVGPAARAAQRAVRTARK